MKFEDLTVGELKKHAKGVIRGYTTMKKDMLVKQLKKQYKLKGGALVPKEKKEDRCWEGYEPVQGKEPYTKGSCQKETVGSGLEDSRRKLKEALLSHMQMLKSFQSRSSAAPAPVEGGQLPCGITEKLKDLQMKGSGMAAPAPAPAPAPAQPPLTGSGFPWENAPNFKGQFEKAGGASKFKDLGSFADQILSNKEKYQPKTVKRARFFKNVLQKKKSS